MAADSARQDQETERAIERVDGLTAREEVVEVSVEIVSGTAALRLEDEKAVTASSAPAAFSRRNLTIAGVLTLITLAFLLTLKLLWGLPPFETSPYAYFNDQGWALLHLHWDIAHPGAYIDLIQVHGKWYSIYGLFPSVLMMPFLAITQNHLSDNLFYAALSAVNVGLLYLLFEQLRASGFSRKSWRENLVWSVLLYLGSIGLSLGLGGGVWYEGHVAACFCLLLCLLLAFRRHYVWAAVALSCGFHSRSTLLFAFPFLFYLAWEDGLRERLVVPFARSLWRRRPDWTLAPWRRLLGVAAVLAGCLGVYLLRNWAMFGTPLESGYGIALQQHYAAYVAHGVFNVRYIPGNLVNDFFNFPRVFFDPRTHEPMVDILNSSDGQCVFLVTPLFLFLFTRNRERSRLRVAMWLTLAVSTLFVLMYYASGFPEFGTRYLFDIFPLAWVILAINDIRLDWRVYALGVFAVVYNALGAYAHYFHIYYFTIHNLKSYFLP